MLLEPHCSEVSSTNCASRTLGGWEATATTALHNTTFISKVAKTHPAKMPWSARTTDEWPPKDLMARPAL
eukprot:9420834-Lingulodinium_polyedra.AAC.1